MHKRGPLDEEKGRWLSTKRGAVHGGEYWAENLSPLGYYHGGPSRPHLYGMPPLNGGRMDLGQWMELIGAAASAYGGGGGSPPAGGPAPGGPTTGMPQPGSTATAVSPTFQTEISPQISPTFQQTQSSPGAVQAATATQYQPGGMSAEGGSAVAQPPPMPGMPAMPPLVGTPSPSYFSGPTRSGGLPLSPLDPSSLHRIADLPSAGKTIRDIRESEPFNWTPVYVIGGVAVAGGLLYLFMTRRKK